MRPLLRTANMNLMQNVVIHKAQDLAADARQVVERVLGRALQEDEEVTIMALSPHAAPEGESRQALARELEGRMNRTAAKADRLSDREEDEVIDEAVNYVRSRPQ